jgi:hypothetical protein
MQSETGSWTLTNRLRERGDKWQQWDMHTGKYRKTMARMLKDSKFLFDSVS